LVTFLEGEWPYPKCFDYLRLLNVEQRRSLWEDIDFQLKEEAQGRSGQDSLEGALAKASTSLELVPLPRQPFRRSFCSRCGTKVTQAYHDLAEPELIMWLCSRCFERGGPWRRPERPPAPESFVMPRRRFG
jgi:ribosomal protein S27AE